MSNQNQPPYQEVISTLKKHLEKQITDLTTNYSLDSIDEKAKKDSMTLFKASELIGKEAIDTGLEQAITKQALKDYQRIITGEIDLSTQLIMPECLAYILHHSTNKISNSDRKKLVGKFKDINNAHEFVKLYNKPHLVQRTREYLLNYCLVN